MIACVMLGHGETIQSTDECCRNPEEWFPVPERYIGQWIRSGCMFRFRRKIVVDEALIAYVMLGHGETIQSTDECCRKVEGWFPVPEQCVGQWIHSGCVFRFRRKIVVDEASIARQNCDTQ